MYKNLKFGSSPLPLQVLRGPRHPSYHLRTTIKFCYWVLLFPKSEKLRDIHHMVSQYEPLSSRDIIHCNIKTTVFWEQILQGNLLPTSTLIMKVGFSETSVHIYRLHRVKYQKTVIFIVTAVKNQISCDSACTLNLNAIFSSCYTGGAKIRKPVHGYHLHQ
jgi:hypothetical protein